LLTAEPVIAYLVTGNAERQSEPQLMSNSSGRRRFSGLSFRCWETRDKERQVMEEFCAYCGEEVVNEGIHQHDNVFCSRECLDAYNEEELLFIDEEERDDF